MAQRLGRRGLLREFRSKVADAVVPRRRRPPGAVSETEFLSRCTKCLDCVEACPQNAIHVLADWVQPGAGTPVMVPDARPCVMCEGFPCARACGEGALAVPSEPVVRLGAVELDATRCLPARGPECGACAGLCPEPVRALALVGGIPTIDESKCIGCGLCIDACPVDPPAIVLQPL